MVAKHCGRENAWCPNPSIEVCVGSLLHEVVEPAHLLQPKHEVVAASGEAGDEEGLEVPEGAPGVDLAREAEGRDEEEMVEIVGRREREAADNARERFERAQSPRERGRSSAQEAMWILYMDQPV